LILTANEKISLGNNETFKALNLGVACIKNYFLNLNLRRWRVIVFRKSRWEGRTGEDISEYLLIRGGLFSIRYFSSTRKSKW
jgi:hypothetical protein